MTATSRMTITAADAAIHNYTVTPIQPYIAPQYLVQATGDEEDGAEVNGEDADTIIEVLDWAGQDGDRRGAIVRVGTEDEPDYYGYYELWAEESFFRAATA